MLRPPLRPGQRRAPCRPAHRRGGGAGKLPRSAKLINFNSGVFGFCPSPAGATACALKPPQTHGAGAFQIIIPSALTAGASPIAKPNSSLARARWASPKSPNPSHLRRLGVHQTLHRRGAEIFKFSKIQPARTRRTLNISAPASKAKPQSPRR